MTGQNNFYTLKTKICIGKYFFFKSLQFTTHNWMQWLILSAVRKPPWTIILKRMHIILPSANIIKLNTETLKVMKYFWNNIWKCDPNDNSSQSYCLITSSAGVWTVRALMSCSRHFRNRALCVADRGHPVAPSLGCHA